jgi:hypothetical protein
LNGSLRDFGSLCSAVLILHVARFDTPGLYDTTARYEGMVRCDVLALRG